MSPLRSRPPVQAPGARSPDWKTAEPKTPLRVLVLEDRRDDADLLVHQLRKAGFNPDWRRVDCEIDYVAALETAPEIILADYTLPQFDALRALRLLQARKTDIPFIVVTGSVGEERAVECMRAGATDYLLKDRLTRLAPAVSRALEQKAVRDEKHAAEDALRGSEEHFRSLIENAQDITMVVDERGTIVYQSPSTERILGYRPDERIGRNALDFIHPDDLSDVRDGMARAFDAPGSSYSLIVRMRDAHGSWRSLEAAGSAHRREDASVRAVINARDVTDRERALEELRNSEARYRSLIENAPISIQEIGLGGRIQSTNVGGVRIMGWSDPSAARGVPYLDTVAEDERARVDRLFQRAKRGEPVEFEYTPALGESDRTFSSTLIPILGDDGSVSKLLGLTQDITGRIRADAALRASERFLARSQEIAHLGSWQWDLGSDVVTCSRESFLICGLGRQPTDKLTHAEWVETVHPSDRSLVLAAIDRAVEAGTTIQLEYRIVRPDGSVRVVTSESEVGRDETGTVAQIVGTIQDVTDGRSVEAEKRQLEEQLRQAQKLEAIGQLAGGVAHDFNNLLTVIGGYADLLENEGGIGSHAIANVREILNAKERAAALTRQLLAFGRKQVMQPKVLDVNETVTQVDKMLRRVIGERISLDLDLDAAAMKVKVDPGQLEQVIMNLVVNARDAMPDGGRVVIRTRQVTFTSRMTDGDLYVEPGRYVSVEIHDDGHGMDPETQARVFDPFFTTKEKGKGTGLGLSTVFGIVKQSHGYVLVVSEPSRGTTFSVYFPEVEAPLELEAPQAGGDRGQGSETVLVAEDDEPIRRLVKRILNGLGYTVVEARDGREALDIARNTKHVDLLLTDLIMPDLNGRELANHFRHIHADARIIYMSGYSDDIASVERDGAVRLLAKPFTAGALGREVRHALDAPRT